MRRSIWNDLVLMQDQMDKLFGGFEMQLAPTKQLGQSNCRKAIATVNQTDNEVTARVELPGVEKKDIDVAIKDNFVEIKVECKSESEDCKQAFKFYRAIPIPKNIDREKVQATYKNGVLELTLPKVEAKETVKKIDVQ